MPLDFAASAGLPSPGPGLARVGLFTHGNRTNIGSGVAPASIHEDNGKARLADGQVTQLAENPRPA